MENKNKIIYCAVLASVTVVLSFAAYHLGRSVNINSRANILMNNSLASFNTEYSNISAKKELLEKQKKELNSQIREKSDINKDIEKSIKDIASAESEITDVQKRINELDSQITEKKSELASVEKAASSTGKKLNISEGTYSCPENISPGQYTISGNYTLIVYNSNGSQKLSENLRHLETKSFTFNISDGERIRIVK